MLDRTRDWLDVKKIVTVVVLAIGAAAVAAVRPYLGVPARLEAAVSTLEAVVEEMDSLRAADAEMERHIDMMRCSEQGYVLQECPLINPDFLPPAPTSGQAAAVP